MKKYIVTLLILTLLITALIGQSDEGFNYQIGDKIPNLEMKDYKGRTVQLSELKGKLIIINMFATWCKPCIKEMNYLSNQLSSKYDKSQLEIISIGYDHLPIEIEYFLEDYDFEFTFIPDFGKELYKSLATTGVPRSIVLDKEGVIIAQKAGFHEEEFKLLVDKIKKLIKQ